MMHAVYMNRKSKRYQPKVLSKGSKCQAKCIPKPDTQENVNQHNDKQLPSNIANIGSSMIGSVIGNGVGNAILGSTSTTESTSSNKDISEPIISFNTQKYDIHDFVKCMESNERNIHICDEQYRVLKRCIARD